MEKKELQQTPRQGRGGVRLGRGVSCWAAPRAGLSQRSEAETGLGVLPPQSGCLRAGVGQGKCPLTAFGSHVGPPITATEIS